MIVLPVPAFIFTFVVLTAATWLGTTRFARLRAEAAAAREEFRVIQAATLTLLGLIISSTLYGLLLAQFSAVRLIQVIQGSAAVVMVLNLASLWKQEARTAKRGQREAGEGCVKLVAHAANLVSRVRVRDLNPAAQFHRRGVVFLFRPLRQRRDLVLQGGHASPLHQ